MGSGLLFGRSPDPSTSCLYSPKNLEGAFLEVRQNNLSTEHLGCGADDLLGRDVARVLREPPAVAEGVGDLAVAVLVGVFLTD
jgi:hypothetical protein